MRFTGDVLTLDSLVATSGRGTIRADGTIELRSSAQPLFDLAVISDGARVLDNEQGRMRADADLAIDGPLDSLAITGNMKIVDGVLYAPEMDKSRPTELDDPTIAAIGDTSVLNTAALRENPLLENMNVDVNVRVARNTWVRNSDTNVEIYTPDDAESLHVRLLPDTGLVLLGVINADRGEYTFSGRVFELTTGTVTFLGGPELDPLLQLTARYEVPRPGREALAILIHITGSMTEPRVALESTAQPPLSQSDLLAYLAFGRPTSSLLSLDASGVSGGGNGIGALAQQQLAGLAIGALVDEAVSDIEREGARAGLDVFRIRPAELPEELAFSGYFQNFLRGTEVLAGKYLGSRVFLAAQGRMTTQAWPGMRVEYAADRGFSFEATWEPRFLPTEPTLVTDLEATTARVFGAFLRWRRRF
jgi:autotransporter translocation and assembly factor TamB